MIDFRNIDLAALWAGKRGENSPIRLVGIRGAQEPGDSPNKLAIYDDVILVEIRDSSFPVSGVSQWNASVDPSWALVVHPINPDGAAQLRPGVHLFEKHLMHGKYPCLGQAEDVHVNRLNADGSLDHVASGQFGICIHSGGGGMNTNRFSAGCQIIRNDDGYFGNPTWNNFWAPIRDAMTAHKLNVIPYRLLDRADLPA
jgi:hypothetical protein